MKIGIQSLLPTKKAQALRKTNNAQELLYHHITNTIRKAIWIGLIFGCHTMASAQQKIKDGSISGNNLPNKDALLELESNNKGLLHARVALRLTTDAFPLTAHVAGMMVYNTTTINDVVPGIYYNDGSKWVFVKSSNAILVEDQSGKTGAPGIPGTVGGPGAGVTIVNNDSGTWVFNPTTNTWTNIRGTQGVQGIQGIQGVAGTNGTNGTDGKSVSSGTTVPSGGSNGDTYINTTTGDVYTNIGGVWTVTGNVRGPQGPQGIQGIAGANGTNGTNGTDGKSVSSGAGAPSGGSNGDTYINTTTGDVYTNTGGVWTVTGNLRGPQGPQGVQGIQGVAGTNGRTILSGTGAPTAGTGSDGDYYIDPVTNMIYGPKAGGGWPAGVSLVGPQGIQGPQGLQGIQGIAGANGTNGTNGTDGKSVSSGTTAPSGGSNGDTYINTTTGDVYTNTSGVWTLTGNVRGPQGPQGIQGVQGVAGTNGTNGTNGTDGKSVSSGTTVPSGGSNGDTYINTTTGDVYTNTGGVWTVTGNIRGPQGPQGIQGPQGPQGLQGIQGVAGTNGTDGKSVSSGAGAPSGGSNGDTYINTTTGDVYTNTGGVWTVTGNIRGPQGLQGIQGVAGTNGTNGTDGKSVSSGAGAPSGGSNGDTYINTTTGDVYTNTGGIWTVTGNIRGPQGLQGIQGVAGTNGTDGKSVSSGTTAPSGGSNGDTYINTTTGDVYTNIGGVWTVTGNLRGPQGPQGIQGIQGVTGTNGTNGTDGRTILSGTGAPSAGTGSDGDYYYDPTTNMIYGPKAGGAWPAGVSLVGPQGIQGPQGPQGIQGIQGVAGTNGTDGKSVSSGAGAPSGGSNGDTYINTTTGDVYTNTGGVWTVTGNVRGPQGVQGVQGVAGTNGTNGTDGRTILSGTGAPSAGTGSDGDYYYDPTTNTIYGPKAGGAWPAGVSLVGPQGIQGPQGPQGLQGIQGVAGTNGTNGTDGKSVSSGAGAPSGGSNGDTYINTTTGDVYTNTGGVWAVTGNIKGPQGPAGTTAAVTADNGLTKTADNIRLGGPLVTPTVITTDATNTLAIAGLQTGASTDNLVVMGAGGVLKSINPSALSVTEVDGVIGNEVTDATANGGLTRAGVGTAASPYTLGLTPGLATGNVMTWNGTSWNPAAPVNIYNANGTLTSNRQVNMGGRSLRFVTPDRDIYFDPNGRIGTEAKGANDGDIYVSSGSGPTYSRLDMQSFPSGQVNLTTTGAGAEHMMIGTSATTLPAPLIFSTTTGSNASGAERMRITGTGLVGIDTDDPTEKLDIGVGNVRIRDINLLSGNTTTDKMVLADVDGILKTAAIPTVLNVYNSNGTLTSARTLTLGGFPLNFSGTEQTISLNSLGWLQLNGQGTNSSFMRMSTTDGNSNGIKSNFDMQLFPDNIMQLYATDEVSRISFGTHETLNPSPIEFVTSPGANAPGQIRMTVTPTGEVAIGTTTAPSFVVGSATIQPKLHVAGDISTTGKIYTTNSVYADYVFEDYFNGFSKIYKDYKFKSLKEVAEFIKAKKHLPGVTPINEIAVGKNGYTIDLTQLSMQQLEKLEELYLHVIEMNDTLSQKDKEIKALQNKTNDLEERLKRLEDLIKK